MRLGARRWLPVALAALSTIGCSLFGSGEESTDSGVPADASPKQAVQGNTVDPHLPPGVEQVGSLWLVKVDVAGFERLEAASQKRAFEHSRAAVVAGDELYRQLGDELPRIRSLLAGILAVGDRVPGGIRQSLRAYSSRFFANHGNLDARTGRK
ncbi:MAG: hypothetical protein JRF63_02975, partial [Deltaproteobacteria bacterium]|nr:hypothetical protein [Deltaproteobacteria bacterium]